MSYIDEEFYRFGYLAEFDVSQPTVDPSPQEVVITDLNEWLMKIMSVGAETVRGNSLDPEVLGTAILIRGVEFFQSAVVLSQRRMLNPARAMIRCFLEDLFHIALLHSEPDTVIERLKLDNDMSRSSLAKIMNKFSELNADSLRKLESLIERKTPQALSMQKLAEARDLGIAYIWYKHYSNISMHTSADSLSPLMVFDEYHRPIGFSFSDYKEDAVNEVLDNLIKFGLLLGIAYNDLTKASLIPEFDLEALSSRCHMGKGD